MHSAIIKNHVKWNRELGCIARVKWSSHWIENHLHLLLSVSNCLPASTASADTLLAIVMAPSCTSAKADNISVFHLWSLNNVSATAFIASFTTLPSVKAFFCFVRMCATLNKASVQAVAFCTGLVKRDCCCCSCAISSLIFCYRRLVSTGKTCEKDLWTVVKWCSMLHFLPTAKLTPQIRQTHLSFTFVKRKSISQFLWK